MALSLRLSLCLSSVFHVITKSSYEMGPGLQQEGDTTEIIAAKKAAVSHPGPRKCTIPVLFFSQTLTHCRPQKRAESLFHFGQRRSSHNVLSRGLQDRSCSQQSICPTECSIPLHNRQVGGHCQVVQPCQGLRVHHAGLLVTLSRP